MEYAELAAKCAAQGKDLWKIMPPDNKLRRRIVEASEMLKTAAKALVEADRLLAVCRDEPREGDVEMTVDEADHLFLAAVIALENTPVDSPYKTIFKDLAAKYDFKERAFAPRPEVEA